MIYQAAHILTMTGETICDGSLFVRDGQIADIGKGLSDKYPNEPVENLGNCVLMPGFVNSHSHIDYTAYRNRHDALNLWDWLDGFGFNSGNMPGYDYFLLSAKLGGSECVCSGITSLGDSTFGGAAAEAMSEIGMRGIVYKELFGQSMGDNYAQDFSAILDKVQEINALTSPLVKVGLSPHSVYTSSTEVLRLCADTCAELGIPIALHLAETKAESQYTVSGSGPIARWRQSMNRPAMVSGLSPTRTLEECGLVRKGVCLAHCVHVSEDEIEMISRSGAGVAHCPRSNGYLGCGIAPVVAFLAAGSKLGLGTDSAASCMKYDFFEEMRTALAYARAWGQDAEVITANDVLRMATVGGAEALGLDEYVGTLEIGKRADIIAVGLSDMLATEDLTLAILARCPSDVRMVIVDGVEVARDGRPTRIDVENCKAEMKTRSS